MTLVNDNRTQERDYSRFIYTQTVYIDPPGVPTAAVHTQTMQVLYNTAEIQTIIVRTQSAGMITEPEPEVEKSEVMMQTEAEEPTPVMDVDTQTIRVKLCESHMQTVKASLSHIHVQTEKPEMSHSLVQTDEVSRITTITPNSDHVMIHLGGYNCSGCIYSHAISCVWQIAQL